MTQERDLLDFAARSMSEGQLQLSQTDPDAAAKFNAFVSQQAADYEMQTGEPRENAFRSLFDRTIGRAAGAAGRGALGASRFVRDEVVPPFVEPFRPLLEDEEVVQPGLEALDAYSKTSGGLAAENLAPLLSGTSYGMDPNAFDAFMADLQQRRSEQSLVDLISQQASRDAFRNTEFAPGVAPLLEGVGDVTNVIPGAAVARPLGLAARTAPRVAGEAVQQAGAATARQTGEAAAARSAEMARRAPEVVPFGADQVPPVPERVLPNRPLGESLPPYRQIEPGVSSRELIDRQLDPILEGQTPDETRLPRRGREQILRRIDLATRTGDQQVVERGGLRPIGVLDESEARSMRELVEALPDEYFENTSLSIRTTPRRADIEAGTLPTAGGAYDPTRGLIELFHRTIRAGNNPRVDDVFIHEVAHNLSRFIPEQDLRPLRAQYQQQKKAFEAGRFTPQRLGEDATNLEYRFSSFNEWFAETFTDRALMDLFPDEVRRQADGVFARVRNMAVAVYNWLRRKGRNDAAERVYKSLIAGENRKQLRYESIGFSVDETPPVRPAGAAGEVPPVTPDDVPAPAATVETPAPPPVDDLEAEVSAVRERLRSAGVPPRTEAPPRRPLTPEEELEAEVSALRGGGSGGATPPGGSRPEGTKRVIDLLRVSKRLRPTVEEEIAAQRAEGARIGRERAETATSSLARSRAFLSGQAGRTTSQRKFDPIAQRVGDEGGNLSDVTPTQASEALGVTADDFEGMFRQIDTVMGRGREFDAGDAKAGLIRLLLGNTATPRQAKLLEQVFGREMAEVARSRTPLSALRKAGEIAYDVGFLLPKTLRSSIDMSALFRQAAIYTINPRPSRMKITAQSFGDMLRVGFARPGEAEKTARDIYTRITDPATNKWARQLYQTGPERTRLYLQNPDKPVLDFTKREEMFASELSSMMPSLGKDFRTIRGREVPLLAQGAVNVATLPIRVVGAGIRRSELMFATYLSQLRNSIAVNTLENWQRVAERTGRPIRQAEVEELRRGINIFTGRGELYGLENSAKFLSAAFWSPRLWAARLEAPVFPFRGLLDPSVRRASAELAKDLVAFTVTGTTILYLMDKSGVGQVEADPRSPNFGKIRVGNRTFDFWGGFQQQARYVTQLLTGERKTLTGRDAGEIDQVRRQDIAFNLIRSKLSPGVPSLVGNELAGRTYDQEPLHPLSQERQRQIARGQADSPNEIRLKEAAEQYVPLFLVDLDEAVRNEGGTGGLFTLPEALGVGVQTFDDGELDRSGR